MPGNILGKILEKGQQFFTRTDIHIKHMTLVKKYIQTEYAALQNDGMEPRHRFLDLFGRVAKPAALGQVGNHGVKLLFHHSIEKC